VRVLIVDGYNVIHAWPELKRLLRDRGGDDARAALVQALSAYASQTGVEVTVVFDAHSRPGGEASSELIDGVTVRFATSTRSADHVIERLAYQAARAQRGDDVVVATDDRLQRNLVGAMGIVTMGARGLLDEVRGAHQQLSTAADDMRSQQQQSRRVEQRLHPEVVARLERLRRGRTE
jgi:uncharacterized protein